MTALSTIRLIAGRELRERVVKKGYLIGTLVTVAVVVGLVIVPSLLGSDGPEEVTLGVVGSVPDGFSEQVGTSLPPETELLLSELDDRDAGIDAIEQEEIDALLVARDEFVTDGRPDPALHTAVEGALQLDAITGNLEAAGLEADDVVAALTMTTSLETTDIGSPDTADSFLTASVLTVLLLIGVQLSGGTLLAGAIEEKSGRVVEMLVSTARPRQLLTAKVAATSLMSFAQIGLIVGSGLLANAYVETVPLPEATASMVAISGVMLIAGFLFYAALFTVAGTMASTVEDAQQAAGPLQLLLFAGYLSVFFAVFPSPSGIVAQILTFLPPTAPFVVPARVAFDAIPPTHVAIAILVTLVGAALTLRFAGRIYASSVLAGGKLTWSGALKAEPVR